MVCCFVTDEFLLKLLLILTEAGKKKYMVPLLNIDRNSDRIEKIQAVTASNPCEM